MKPKKYDVWSCHAYYPCYLLSLIYYDTGRNSNVCEKNLALEVNKFHWLHFWFNRFYTFVLVLILSRYIPCAASTVHRRRAGPLPAHGGAVQRHNALVRARLPRRQWPQVPGGAAHAQAHRRAQRAPTHTYAGNSPNFLSISSLVSSVVQTMRLNYISTIIY